MCCYVMDLRAADRKEKILAPEKDTCRKVLRVCTQVFFRFY